FYHTRARLKNKPGAFFFAPIKTPCKFRIRVYVPEMDGLTNYAAHLLASCHINGEIFHIDEAASRGKWVEPGVRERGVFTYIPVMPNSRYGDGNVLAADAIEFERVE